VVRRFFALACELSKECLAALHRESHEIHAADNAFVAGIEEPLVHHNMPVWVARTCSGKRGCDEDAGGASTGHVVHPLVRDASTQPMAGSPARIYLSIIRCHRGSLLKNASTNAGPAWFREARGRTSLRTEEWRPDGDGLKTFRGLLALWAMVASWASVSYELLPTRVHSRRSSAAVRPRLCPWQRVGLVSKPSYPE